MDIVAVSAEPLTDDGVTLRNILAWGHTGRSRIDVIDLPAGSSLPRHRAGTDQTLYVISGRGRVAGADDVAASVSAGQAVRWVEGDDHTTWADEPMTVLVVQTIVET
ncbi:cupin domain-containing protein [Nakamurella flavida]|uniref:Cupin domain-containing protein n=1 Tax=Nakamurella flavida TaxID=363630 RepID=A0A939C0A0_9ACTN|nr:cupin domain-containing protein [Nakamurella flavida]MBM9476503.1 cupin domain-containing protein [Nakamurella flavida]MDP9779060.1 quercetin dioxygenase-like cupin family protein [Nakamurella flavida]